MLSVTHRYRPAVDQALGDTDEEAQSTGKKAEGAVLHLKVSAGKMAAELAADKREALALRPDSVVTGWVGCREMLRSLAAVAPDHFLPAAAAPRAKPPSVAMRAPDWQPDASFFEKLVREGPAAAAAAEVGFGFDSTKPRLRGKSTGAKARARTSSLSEDPAEMSIAEEAA